MRCYYEELGVERDASEADIKSCYKKLALRWHPDKNPDSMEEAKQRFLLIQQAYEVLIDPQERAFYDNHREQILRGKNSSYEDNCLNVFEYFTVTCFRGYGDDANGFYAVYKEVFDKIAAEDAEFMQDEADIENIPSFGNSQSNYEEVVGAFYAHWSAYCTKKTYSWLCPYDIVEAKDRRVIRAIDKEMKKVVQKAKKERNDEVRSLVAFVRKRDRRVQDYIRKLEERVVLNRQKQEQRRLEQLQMRQQKLQDMQNSKKSAFDEAYEAQLKELEQQYGDSSSSSDDDDELRGYVVETNNAHYIEEFEDDGEDVEDVEEEEIANNIDNLFCVACNKSYKHKRAFASHETSKKHIDNMENLRKVEEAAENTTHTKEENDDISQLSLEELETSTSNKQKKKKSKSKQSSELETNTKAAAEVEALPALFVQATILSDDEEWSNKKTVKKKKSKKTTENMNSETTKTQKPAAEVEDVAPMNELHACATCNKQFNSKNKLFTHLKSTNHSIYLPGKGKPPIDMESGSKKGKGKRK